MAINLTEIAWYWWVFAGMGTGAFAWLLGFTLAKLKNRKDKVQENKHTHSWQDRGYTVAKDRIRIIKTCTNCGISVHVPVYTGKQLRDAGVLERCD